MPAILGPVQIVNVGEELYNSVIRFTFPQKAVQKRIPALVHLIPVE